MKKRFAALFLILTMLVCGLPGTLHARADEASEIARIEKSMKTIVESVNNLKKVLGEDECSTIADIFNGVMSVFSTVGSIVGPINGSIAFLRLIGLMEDPTGKTLANISQQLAIIKEKIAQMDTKLDVITEQMQVMKATEEFDARTIKSIQMVGAWHSFESNYMEDKMDELMRQYNVMLMDGLKEWMENKTDSARHGGNVELDKVILWYHCVNAPDPQYPGPVDELEFELQNTDANQFSYSESTEVSRPDPYTIYADQWNTRADQYVILDESFFPAKGELYWDVNTFREDLKSFIKEKINGYIAAGDYSHFTTWNMYAFNPYGDASIRTEELIDRTAQDAVDQIIYRIVSTKINESSDFPSKVVTYFGEYCNHLIANQQGLDAMLMSMYLTSAFEYQISDDITAFLDQMALKTGVYALFAQNIAGLSKSVPDSDKVTLMANLCDAMEKIQDAKETAISGNGAYSYVTGSVLDYGEVTFTASATADWRHRTAYYAFCSSGGGDFSTSFVDGDGRSQSSVNMIGDSSAVLLSYVLSAQGETLTHDFMNEHLATVQHTDYGALLTTIDGQRSMDEGADVKLHTHNIMGDYFAAEPTVRLNELPGDAEFGYVGVRTMMQGTIYDPVAIKLYVNSPLAGIAVYGENHNIWVVDEVALLGGSRSNTFSDSSVDERTGSDILTNVYYTTTYSIETSFNCLTSKPLVNAGESGEKYDALGELQAILEELKESGRANSEGEHEHEWDEGVISQETGEIIYTCKLDPSHVRTEAYPQAQTVALSFDPAGGTFLGSTDAVEMEFTAGSNILLPGPAEREGYKFVCWSSEEFPADAEYTVSEARTFTAVWEESESELMETKPGEPAEVEETTGAGETTAEPEETSELEETTEATTEGGSEEGAPGLTTAGRPTETVAEEPVEEDTTAIAPTEAETTAPEKAEPASESYTALWVIAACAVLMFAGFMLVDKKRNK